MRVILAGTRRFGAAAMNMLADRPDIELAAVHCPTEDRQMFDHLADRAPWTPNLRSFLERDDDVDLIVAAHSHAFISRKVRNMTRLGAIGYHPSLLPRHRGRDAVRWTIHMRDPVAGGSVYWLNDNVDGGPVAAQQHLLVDPSWDYHDLWRRLFPIGVELLSETLDDLAKGVVRQVAQDEAVATWEPSWERSPLFRPDLPELGAMPDGYRLEIR